MARLAVYIAGGILLASCAKQDAKPDSSAAAQAGAALNTDSDRFIAGSDFEGSGSR